MEFHIITIFPNMFESVIKEGVLKRAQMKNLVKINIVNLRDYAKDKHKVVDDYTYGGGVGMILKPEPIFSAVEDIKQKVHSKKIKVILTSPGGDLFSQKKADDYTKQEHIIIICGRYEGVDERVKKYLIDEEISIGDYVLSGGELPAMVMMEAITRLISGVLEKEEGIHCESFTSGLLEYPQYTRPSNFREMKVPEVLLSGNHKEIEKWRKYKSLEKTYHKRKDLLEKRNLTFEEKEMLKEIKRGECR